MTPADIQAIVYILQEVSVMALKFLVYLIIGFAIYTAVYLSIGWIIKNVTIKDAHEQDK